MTVAHPKAVPVELGGTTRLLVYTFAAFSALRDVGVDAFNLGETDLADPRILTKLVWAGLLRQHPEVTVEEVGDWIDLENLPRVAKAFTRAFAKSQGRDLDPS